MGPNGILPRTPPCPRRRKRMTTAIPNVKRPWSIFCALVWRRSNGGEWRSGRRAWPPPSRLCAIQARERKRADRQGTNHGAPIKDVRCTSFLRTVRGANHGAREGKCTAHRGNRGARGGKRTARGAGCSARASAAVHALNWLKNRGAVRSRFGALTVNLEGTVQTIGSTKEKDACSTAEGACTTWAARAVRNRAVFEGRGRRSASWGDLGCLRRGSEGRPSRAICRTAER